MKKAHGVDFSHFQTDEKIFEAVLQTEDFIILKATEGKDYSDPTFIERARRVKAQAKPLFAYHFFGFQSQKFPKEQVDYFLEILDKAECKVIPVFDLEKYLGRNPDYYGQVPPLSACEEMVQYFYDKTSIYPVIYSSPADLESIITTKETNLTRCPLWIAHWVEGEPSLPRRPHSEELYWEDYTIWQYTDKPYDQNWFNGDTKALHEFWKQHIYTPRSITERVSFNTISTPSLPARSDQFFTYAQPAIAPFTEGVSLSHWQDDQLFQNKLRNNIPLFIRATLGVNDKDKRFYHRACALYQHNQNTQQLVPWCAYHLFSPDPKSLPQDQAKDFLNAIDEAAKEMNANTPVLLGIELAKTRNEYPKLNDIKIFLQHIEKEKGVKLIIRGNSSDLEEIFKYNQEISLLDYPLYITQWDTQSPHLPKGGNGAKVWSQYTFWEYSKEPCLQFKFNGSSKAFIEFFKAQGYTFSKLLLNDQTHSTLRVSS
jgi:lysozyme